MKTVKISPSSFPDAVVRLKYCGTFFSKFLGLMFSGDLREDHGIILVENRESRINTSIHMLFMRTDLTVLWLDKEMVIVDKVLAKKWMPIYFSKRPAQYVIELHPSKFTDFSIGEKLSIDHGD